MYEISLLPVFIYLTDSIASGIYAWSFLKGNYVKRTVLAAWPAAYFFIQIVLFELSDRSSPIREAPGVILNGCILLLMLVLFFQKDMQKQLFVVFSFLAGKQTVKYIASVFCFVFTGVWNKSFDLMFANDICDTLDRLHVWAGISSAAIAVVCALVYALLFSGYLLFINKEFVRKDHRLQAHEDIFLILPCIAALCISITIKMMILSVEDGMTIMIYDTVPETKFWIPFICILLLSSIIASVILFQKWIEYHEETKKRVILEDQMQQMRKEIEEIQDIYADMRGLRHDMRSHIANISLLVRNMAGPGDERLESYIGKMEETVKRLDFDHQTGNPITDVIIHQKGQEAKKKQIGFQSDLVYPAKLLIDVYDIAVILDNALENAIEACCRAEGKKQVTLHSYVKGSLFFIEIENDLFDEVVIEEKSGLPVSSKEDGTLHGIGISNIQRCARKYRGDIDIAISDVGGRKKFCLTVMMNGKSASAI